MTVRNIGFAWEAGADAFVAGTAVFGATAASDAVGARRRRCAVRV